MAGAANSTNGNGRSIAAQESSPVSNRCDRNWPRPRSSWQSRPRSETLVQLTLSTRGVASRFADPLPDAQGRMALLDMAQAWIALAAYSDIATQR